MRVAVGMSGGVDSSVAAALLKVQGHDVTGIFIEAYNETTSANPPSPKASEGRRATAGKSGCRTDEDKRDALLVASKLGIKFEVLDLRKEYKETVVKYFFDEYRTGRTPNPDIVCNREIKFGLFYDWAMKNGFASVATGHYARITDKGELKEARDKTKDQSYFLWQVPGDHLKNTRWPLGELTKKEVRVKAKELQLPNAEKPDSMGVCMLGELNVGEFLRDKLGVKPGDVVWKDRVVGRHEGLWFVTIGQRGGWEYNAKLKTQNSKLDVANMPPLYVIGKDTAKNQIIIGEHEEAWRQKFRIMNYELWEGERKRLSVRIRNLGEKVEVIRIKGGTVTLAKPLYGVAPGQSAVFYDEAQVVAGGAIIC